MSRSAVPLSRWLQAQEFEGKYWKNAGSRSHQVLGELTEHSEYIVRPMLEALGDRRQLKAIEIGIGALGIGFLSVYAAHMCSEIVGVEPLPIQMIALNDAALATYASTLQSRVQVLQQRAEELPFDDESFDLACCINVLDHTHDPFAILSETHRVLKREGILMLGVHTRSSLVRCKWWVQRTMRMESEQQKTHPHTFGWGSMSAGLKKSWKILWAKKPSLFRRSVGYATFSVWMLERQ